MFTSIHDDDYVAPSAPQKSISSLVESFTQLMKQSKTQDLKRERDITLSAFDSLLGKFQRYASQFKAFFVSQSINDQNHLAINSLQLNSSILPSLRHRITSLSLSLDPSDIQKEPVQKLKLILEVLLELEKPLDQIEIIFRPVPDDPQKSQSTNSAASDTSIKDLIKFKYERLIWKARDLIEEIYRLLHASRQLISGLSFSDKPQSSSKQEKSSQDLLSYSRKQIVHHTACSWELIDKLKDSLSRSECCLVQEEWQGMVGLVDDAMNELLTLINPPPTSDVGRQACMMDAEEEEDYGDADYKPPQLSQKTLEIGKLTVPILKLSRLFLNKLSKTKANKEPLTMLSGMSSSQLYSLFKLTQAISPMIDDLIASFDDQGEDEETVDQGKTEVMELFARHVDELSECFKSCLSILLPYLESLSSFESDDQIPPKTWFETWNQQFDLTTQKFKNGCNVL